MTPEWLRPEWRLDHPSYWAPCADPSLIWEHTEGGTGLGQDGTLSRRTRHLFGVASGDVWPSHIIPHRLDGPAVITVGVPRYEFRVNGLRHRLGAPAVNSQDWEVSFWVKGNLHRLDGPALFRGPTHREWWVNGVRLLDNPSDLDILGALL